MRMRALRRLQAQAPRRVKRRREFDLSDATMEPEPSPPPEAVFDRVTGPYGRRHVLASWQGDEET
jgi:hypothetical protein